MKVLVIIEGGERFATSLRRALSVSSYKDAVIKRGDLEDLQSSLASAVDRERIIILQTEFGKGVELLESLRRDLRLLAPVIILFSEKREKLEKKCPIVREGVPGSYFIKAPFCLRELKEVLEKAEDVSSGQLEDVVLKYCHIEDSLRIMLHDMINTFRTGNVDKTKRLFQRLRRELDFLPGRFNAEIKKIDEMLGEKIDKEALSNLLFEIQERLNISQEESAGLGEIVTIPTEIPPEGFECILIVDDDGYDRSSMERLKEIGYNVELITSHKEALCKFEYDPPDVLLCDWRLERNPEYGREIALRGLEKIRLVILISADRIEDPPCGVETCVGKDKFDTGLIHRLICRKAGSL